MFQEAHELFLASVHVRTNAIICHPEYKFRFVKQLIPPTDLKMLQTALIMTVTCLLSVDRTTITRVKFFPSIFC